MKNKDGMDSLADGVKISASRADGLKWADPTNVCSEYTKAIQEDIMHAPGNIKADLELVFVLPGGGAAAAGSA